MNFGSVASHPLDKPGEIFDHVSKLLAVRKQHSALQIGSYRELWRQGSPANANVWVFFREDPQASSKAIVALNNGKHSTNGPLSIGVQGRFPDGTVLIDVLGQASFSPIVVKNDAIAFELPAQLAAVLVPAP